MEILELIVDLIKNLKWVIIVLILKKSLGEALVLISEGIKEFLKNLCHVTVEKNKDNWKINADSMQVEVSPMQTVSETEKNLPSGPAEDENKFQEDKLKTLLKENKFVEIEKECKKGKDKDKKNTYLYFSQGKAYIKQGRYESAIEELKEAIRLNPDFANAHFNLGLAYGEKGLWYRAIEYYERALEIAKAIGNKQGESACYTNLGGVYGILGEYKRAIEYQERALEIAKAIGDKAGESKCYTN
ncbi:tetratricopeptide repeat protein, partial [bacterium]|nr:tetratricopeptide repeat protein [bacterium]